MRPTATRPARLYAVNTTQVHALHPGESMTLRGLIPSGDIG
jgi:hypothetical protein